MIKEIAFTAYRVTDITRAREFYEQVLGLKVTTDYGGQWIEYELGSGTFVIQTFTPDLPSGQRGSITFEVDDIDATVATLKAKDVPFLMEVTESPVCHIAIVSDPDGNPVGLHKRKAAAVAAQD